MLVQHMQQSPVMLTCRPLLWQGGAGPAGGFSWDDVVSSGERGKRAAEEAFYGVGDFFRWHTAPCARGCAARELHDGAAACWSVHCCLR